MDDSNIINNNDVNNNNANDNDEDDENIVQFLSITNSSDPTIAQQYLEMGNGNLEMAVSLFMEYGGGGIGGGEAGAVGHEGGGGGGFASSSSAASAAGGMGVRAPDATRTMRLVGGPNDEDDDNPPIPAALIAALGGPAAREMMMTRTMMMRQGMGDRGAGVGGGLMMDDENALGRMGGMWAAAPSLSNSSTNLPGTRARASNDSNRSASLNHPNRAIGSGGNNATDSSRHHHHHHGGGGPGRDGSLRRLQAMGGSGSSGGRGRATTGNQGNDDDDDDDDDEVQIVNSNGEAMDEDEDMEFHYDDDDDDEDNFDDDDDDDEEDDEGDGREDYNDDDDDEDESAPIVASDYRTHTSSNQQQQQPPQTPSLSTMFAPPTHLMHRAGGFLGARNFAKDARRWLLVNIQSDADFACHALNRDVWRDELVESLVREGFILWQAMSNSAEGQTYVTRYKVIGYPHLAILDPRTGSLLWRKEGWTQVNPLTAEQFVEIASDFCSRHSFDKLPTAARHAYTNGIPLGGGGSGGGGSIHSGSDARPGHAHKRPIHELTEEEQLQAAIRASMGEIDDSLHDEDDDGEVEVLDSMEADDAKKPEAKNDDATKVDKNNVDAEEERSTFSFQREILAMEVGEEPTASTGGEDVARVQIRMPDGKRLVRKFYANSPVKLIYAFVVQNNDEAKAGRVFELKAKFPPQDLLANVEDGIKSCGLDGEAINVVWK